MRTNNEKQKFLEILEETPIISIASKRSNIDKSTIYRWIKRDKKFKEKLLESLSRGRGSISDRVESVLIKKAINGERWAVQMWLGNNCSIYVKPRPVNIFARDLHKGYEIEKDIIGNEITFVDFRGKNEDDNLISS
jgi:hypothetical protein